MTPSGDFKRRSLGRQGSLIRVLLVVGGRRARDFLTT